MILKCSDLCNQFGIKPKSEAWLKRHNVPIHGYVSNPHGRKSAQVSMLDMVRAVREDQVGWPEWKPFEFECCWRGKDPIAMLYMIVLACRPDYELLKAVMNLALDPDCHILLRLGTNDFGKNDAYAFAGFERLLWDEIHLRFQNVLEEWNIYTRAMPQRSFGETWELLKKDVRSWPNDADHSQYSYTVYDGVLLLANPPYSGKTSRVTLEGSDGYQFTANQMEIIEGDNYIVRCPSYLKRFREILKQPGNYPALPAELEKLFKRHRTSGMILPNWLWKGLSPLVLSHKLMSIPEIEAYLKTAEHIECDGRQMTAAHMSWSDFKSVTDLINHHALQSGIKIELQQLRKTVRAWNYRAKLDSEKFQKSNPQGGDVDVERESVRSWNERVKRDSEEMQEDDLLDDDGDVDTFSEKDAEPRVKAIVGIGPLSLSDGQLSDIWGGLVRRKQTPYFRKPKATKRTKSSA
jgi:hypothetical protein